VDVAYDGEESLRLAEVNNYDLLVLDLNLPKVDGMEVARRLRIVNRDTHAHCARRTGLRLRTRGCSSAVWQRGMRSE